MLERLADIEARYIELEQQLTDPEVIADHRRVQELAQERSDIETVVHLYRQYRDSSKQLEDAKVLLREGDDEMRDLAREEVDTLTEEVERLNQELTIALLPKDALPADWSAAIADGSGNVVASVGPTRMPVGTPLPSPLTSTRWSPSPTSAPQRSPLAVTPPLRSPLAAPSRTWEKPK